MDEVIVVNEKDEEVEIVSRTKAHKEGLSHRVAAVYVTRSNGDILIQERISGRLDHSSAGHVDPGESYLEAARRELCEELGICDGELYEVGSAKSDEHYPNRNEHVVHVFKIFEIEAEPSTLAEEEVKSVFWENSRVVWKNMQSDTIDKIYTGGFKHTLREFIRVKNI